MCETGSRTFDVRRSGGGGEIGYKDGRLPLRKQPTSAVAIGIVLSPLGLLRTWPNIAQPRKAIRSNEAVLGQTVTNVRSWPRVWPFKSIEVEVRFRCNGEEQRRRAVPIAEVIHQATSDLGLTFGFRIS